MTVAVVSWDDAFDQMLPASGPAECDLHQLRGACRALQGADVTALTESDLAGGWKHRKEDIRRMVDRVTREAIAQLSLSLAPWQRHPSGGLDGGFRYLAPPDLPNLAVGMRSDEAEPPLWVRWHRYVQDKDLVESRLQAAGFAVQKVQDQLWLPLELEPDAGSAKRQIKSLVAQVVAMHKVAVGWSEPV